MIELKRFTKPGILMRIQVQFLVRFLEMFKEELKAKNCPVTPAEPGCDSFYSGLANMFRGPEYLPEAMVEALFAIEEQVTPENWPRLGATIARARQYGIFGV